jgi:hypothetical protein
VGHDNGELLFQHSSSETANCDIQSVTFQCGDPLRTGESLDPEMHRAIFAVSFRQDICGQGISILIEFPLQFSLSFFIDLIGNG